MNNSAKSTKKKVKKKLPHGFGSVFFLEKRNRFVGEVTVEIEGNKVRKTFYGKKEKEVIDKIIEYQNQVKVGAFNKKDKTTIFELGDKIIEEQFLLNEIGQSTYDRKKETLKALSSIHDLAIQSVTEQHMKNFFISKIAYSQSSLDKMFQMLKKIFKEAIKQKIIKDNPMDCFDKTPRSKKEHIKVRAFTIEEEKKLIEILKTEKVLYKEQILLSLFTGLRMGEINALEVKDIDFKSKSINVCKTISRGLNGKNVVRHATKTRAGMRVVPISDEIADYLKTIIGDKKEGQIFLSTKGEIITTNQVNYQLSQLLKKHNIIDKTVDGKLDTHSCRHTYSTRCIEGGMDAKVLQKVLGHQDISVTLNTYTDVFMEFQRDSMDTATNYMKSNNIMIN